MDLHTAIFLTLVAGAFAGPLNLRSEVGSDDVCSRTCVGTSKFTYEPGKIYEYEYEGKTVTGIHGASEDQSTLLITSRAHIEVISKCEFTLTLKNTVIKGSVPSTPYRLHTESESALFKRTVEAHSLRFSFQDGIVEEVCPHSEEPVWVLNFKRGILSAFQNGMDSFDQDKDKMEVDVSGKCQTSYKIAQDGWRSKTIKKTKALEECTDRMSFDSLAQSTLYQVPASLQSLPLMKSTYECDQEIATSGLLKNVVCHESHMFRPFSKEQSGAITEVTQTLRQVQVLTAGSPNSATFGSRKTMLFDHEKGETRGQSTDTQAAVSTLRELCQSTQDDTKQNTPTLFADLVQQLKKLTADSLDDVFNQVNRRSFCSRNTERIKKFYMDAVPMVGTGASIRQITRKIISNDVTGVFAEMWLASLAFIQHPSQDMLFEIKKLLEFRESNKVILPISALVNTYCKNHPECGSVTEVTDIISWFAAKLGGRCQTTDSNYMQVLLSLRALGNTGYAQQFVPTLESCFSAKENPMEIRVAAVEAYRRLSCTADRNNLMLLYRDDTEDSEIRIAAYLQLIKCPTAWTITQIKEQLAAEEVNQVGSFVWTHLTNLMETSDPSKQDIRSILEDEVLQKEFDLDKRKFSRNYEVSYFSEAMNVGGNMEANLVWSQKTFVPRSLMTNLTVDLFGHSFNLLEIGGRVEGLEHLLESYFGPAGYFSGADSENTPPPAVNKALNMNKLNKIHERLNVPQEEVTGSIYMRVFGNEVKYLNLRRMEDVGAGDKFNIKAFLTKLAKNGDASYSYSNMFLDSSIIIPTAVGLPLNLTVHGTMTMDISGTRKLDVKVPSNLVLLEADIKPSGAIVVSSMMSVDAFVTKGGMKMLSTLHTSTAIQGKVELAKKQALVVEFNIPKEQSDVFTAKTSFFLVQGHQEKEQNMLARDKVETSFCTGRTLAKITGLELCSEISLTNSTFRADAPKMPLSGPVSVTFKLLNRDLPNGYKFQFKKVMTNALSLVHLSYDTPGSKTNRLTLFNAEVKHQQKTVKIDMVSPWKKAVFTGSLVNREENRKVEGNLVIDDSTTYAALLQFRRQDNGAAITYTPLGLITIPDRDPIKLSGNIVYRKKKSMTANLALTGARNDPVTLLCTLKATSAEKSIMVKYSHKEGDTWSHDSKLLIKSGKASSITTYNVLSVTRSPSKILAYIKGRVIHKKDASAKFDLNINKITIVPIKIKGLVTKQGKKYRTQYRGRVRYTGPKKTDVNVRFDADKRKDGISANTKITYNFIKVNKVAKDTMIFNWKVVRKIKVVKTMEVVTNFKSGRYADYNNRITVTASHRPTKFGEIDMVLDHGRAYLDKDNKRRMSVHAESTYHLKPDLNKVIYSGNIQYPMERFHLAVSGVHVHTKKSVNSSLTLDYKKERIMEGSIYYANKGQQNLFDYSAGGSLLYKGRHVKLDGSVLKANADTYTGDLTVQHQRNRVTHIRSTYRALSGITHEVRSSVDWYDGKKTSVTTIFSHPSNTSYQVSTSLQLYDGKSFSGKASADMNRYNPQGSITFAYGNNNYTMMVSGENHATYRKMESVIRYPTRHILFEMGGGKKNERYEGKFDVQWDVENQVSDSRVMLEFVYKNGGIQDFEASARFRIPKHMYAATVRHVSTDRYNTFVEVAWSPEKKIEAEVLFRDDHRKFRRTITAMGGLKTPFDHFEELNAAIDYSNSRKLFMSGFSVTYARGQTVGLTFTAKKPYSINYLDFEVTMKTPHQKVGNPTLKVSQLLAEDYSEHTGISSLTWGQNQFMYIDTDGAYLGSSVLRKWTRNIGITSSVQGYESITLNVTHQDNSRQFKSKAIYNNNGRILLYDIDMNFVKKDSQIQSQGIFNISSPNDNLHIEWSHVNTDRDVRSSTTMNWSNGQRFAASFTGNIQTEPTTRVVADFTAEIPHPKLRRLTASFERTGQPGIARIKSQILADRENIGKLETNYIRGIDGVSYDVWISSKYMDDFKTEISTRDIGGMKHKADLKVEWAPTKRIIVDASATYDGQKSIDGSATIKTPFQIARNLVLTGSHKLQGLNWVGAVGIQYAPRQKIDMETTYRYDPDVKVGRIKIMTPFPHFQQIDTGLEMEGPPENFKLSADYQMIPYTPREQLRAEFMRQAARGRSSELLLEYRNPIVTIAKIELSNTPEAGTQKTKAILEFIDQKTMEKRKLEVDGSYTLNELTGFDGNFRFKSPYTDDIIIGYRQTGNVHNMHNHWDVQYLGNKRVVGDLKFGDTPMLNGLLVLKTPYPGSERMEMGFKHRGTEWRDFSTQVVYGTNDDKVEVDTTLNVAQKSGKLVIKSPFPKLQILQLAGRHSQTDKGFTNHAQFIYNENELQSDTKFSHDEGNTIGEIVLKTPHQQANDVIIKVHRQGTFPNMQVTVDAKRNTDELECNTVMNHDESATSFTIATKNNLEGVDDVGITMVRDGHWNDMTFSSTMMKGNQKIRSQGVLSHSDATTSFTASVSGSPEWLKDTSIAFTREGKLIEGKVSGNVIYDSTKYEVDYKMSHTERRTKGHVTITSPMEATEKWTFLIKRNGLWDNFDATTEATLGTTTAIGRTEFTLTDALTSGKFTFTSNVEKLNDLTATLKRRKTSTGMKFEMDAIYGEDTVNSEVEYTKVGNSEGFNFLFTTTVDGVEDVQLTTTRVLSESHFKYTELGRYGTKTINSEIDVQLQGENSAKITLKSINNYASKKKFEVVMSGEGSLRDYKTYGQFVCDEDKLETTFHLTHTKATTTGELKVTTTLDDVKDLTAAFKRNGGWKNFNVLSEIKYGDQTFTTSLTDKITGNDAVIRGTFTSPYNEDVNIKIEHKTKRRGITTNIKASMGTDYTVNWNIICKAKKNDYSLDSVLSGRYRGQRKVGQISLSYKGKWNDHTYKASGKWQRNVYNHVQVVSIHSINNIKITSTTTYSGPDIQHLKDVSYVIQNVKTGNSYKSKAALQGQFELESELDFESADKSFVVMGKTPYEGYESLQLTFTHSGSPKDFKTIASLSATPITPVRSELTYSINDDYHIDFNFKFNRGEQDALIVLLTREMHYELLGNIALDSARKIELTYTYKLEKDRALSSSILNEDFTLRTPFESVREYKYKSFTNVLLNPRVRPIPSYYKHTYESSYNGKNVWRRNIVLDYDRKAMNADITSEMYPVHFTLTAQGRPDITFDGNFIWNKNEENAKVRLEGTASYELTASRKNKALQAVEFDIKIIHSSRTVGIKANYRQETPIPRSSMEISWDQAAGKKAGYELRWQQLNSNEKNGFVRILTPMRSVELTGTMSAGSPRVVEYTLYWDASRDRSSHATLRLEKDNDFMSKRAGINFNSARGPEVYSVHVQEWMNRGNSLYESRTEISYSDDDSKSVVLSARLDDLSVGNNKNHSLSLGLAQAYTNVDVTVTAHIGNGPDLKSAGVSLETLTASRQKKNMLLMAEINQLKKQMNLMMVGPVKSVGLSAVAKTEDPLEVAITSTYDAHGLVNSAFTYNKDLKLVELRTAYDLDHPNSIMHLKAKYPSRLDFEAEMYRTGTFPRVSDSLLTLRLKSSRLLHTKIQWRPEMMSEFLTYSGGMIEKYGDAVSNTLQQMANEFGNELTQKYTVISHEILAELSPLTVELSNEIEAGQAQLRRMQNKINKWQQQNDFYLRDIGEKSVAAYTRFLRQYRAAMVTLKQAVVEMRQKMADMSDEIKTYPIRERYDEAVNTISAKALEYRQILEEKIRTEKNLMKTRVTEALQEIRQKLNELTDKLDENMRGLLEEISQHPLVQDAKSSIDVILASLPEGSSLPDIDYKQHLQKISDAIKAGLAKLDLDKEYEQLVTRIQAQFSPLMNDQDIIKLQEIILEFNNQFFWSLQDWDLRACVKELTTDLYNSAHNFLTEDIGKLKIIHWDKHRLIAFDPQNGLIEFEIYLPSRLTSLDRLPKLNIRKYVTKISKVWDKYAPILRDYNMWDIYYKYMPSFDPEADWLPPFKTYGVVSGSRTFITFDKHRFDFAGMCSFVLAHDLHDKNFTVILNYNRNRRNPEVRSFLILAEGKSVELFPDFSIRVDNRPAELPFSHGRLYVKREGNHVILDSGTGMTVTGDMEHKNFFVGISGWYHGRVAGLLGTHDNEKYNDMMTSTGQMTDNVNALATSWQINSRCRIPGNIATAVTIDESAPGHSQCAPLFQQNDSPLRPCFKVIDPKTYMETCVIDLQTGNADTCRSAALYVKMCQMSGVKIWMPQQCIECTTPNGEGYNAGELIKLSPASDDYRVPQSADVVFVVESRQCNRKTAAKLGEIVYETEQAMSSSSISNNRYGLISFGKRGAVSHTIEGQLLNDATKFTKGTESLSYNDDSSDSLQALIAAANFPFRTGVSKTIVLVQCDMCPNTNAVDYGHLKHLLFTRDITLHILRDQGFRLSGNRSPKDKILGVDNMQKYFLAKVKDESVYEDMTMPSDSCASLAMASNGSLFDSTSIHASNIRNKKKAIKLISRRVGTSATPEECQVCHCMSDATGSAKSVCRKCYTSFADYIPQIWNNLKHPDVLQNQFEQQLKDYLGDSLDLNVYSS